MNLFILLSALLLALLSNGALGSALEEPHLLRRHVDLGTSTLEGGDVKNYLMPDGRFYLEFWKSSKTMERRSHGESDDGCGGLPGPDYTVTEEPNGNATWRTGNGTVIPNPNGPLVRRDGFENRVFFENEKANEFAQMTVRHSKRTFKFMWCVNEKIFWACHKTFKTCLKSGRLPPDCIEALPCVVKNEYQTIIGNKDKSKGIRHCFSDDDKS